MSTTILKAEVQSRIDSLVYSSGTLQAKEVLQESVNILGLDLNLTNLIAVHTSMTSAVGGSTSAKDVTALSAASVNLGITNKPLISPIKSIQRGESSVGTVTISDVDLSKAKLNLLTTYSMWGNNGSGTYANAEIYVNIKLTSANTLEVSLVHTGTVVTPNVLVSWEVIEYV